VLRRFTAVPVAVFVVVALVAVPTTAARLITGKDVKNSSLTGIDIKNASLTGKDVKNSSLTGADVKDSSLTGADVVNGSITAADLAAGIGAAPATRYRDPVVSVPAYASTFAPAAGTSVVQITTTRAGDVLLLSASPLTVSASASGPDSFDLGIALFVDGELVPGAASNAVGAIDDSFAPPPLFNASNSIGLNGIVIPDLAAGVHDLEVRLWHTTVSSPATSTAFFQSFTVVELG
jgi:hypothetical protein